MTINLGRRRRRGGGSRRPPYLEPARRMMPSWPFDRLDVGRFKDSRPKAIAFLSLEIDFYATSGPQKAYSEAPTIAESKHWQ